MFMLSFQKEVTFGEYVKGSTEAPTERQITVWNGRVNVKVTLTCRDCDLIAITAAVSRHLLSCASIVDDDSFFSSVRMGWQVVNEEVTHNIYCELVHQMRYLCKEGVCYLLKVLFAHIKQKRPSLTNLVIFKTFLEVFIEYMNNYFQGRASFSDESMTTFYEALESFPIIHTALPRIYDEMTSKDITGWSLPSVSFYTGLGTMLGEKTPP